MGNLLGWKLVEYMRDEGKLILSSPSFDVDSFPVIGQALGDALTSTVIEKQFDADLHSWLIDFEGCRYFLRAEHYSESVWLEAVSIQQSKEESDFLAKILSVGI